MTREAHQSAREYFIAELTTRNAEVVRANEQHGTYSVEYRRALARWSSARKALERLTRIGAGA